MLAIFGGPLVQRKGVYYSSKKMRLCSSISMCPLSHKKQTVNISEVLNSTKYLESPSPLLTDALLSTPAHARL